MSRPPESGEARDVPRTFRLTQAENAKLEQQAFDRGFDDASSYLRTLIKEDAKPKDEKKSRRPWDA